MNKRDLLAVYLSWTYCHKTGTGPPSFSLFVVLTKHFFFHFQHDPENNKACVPGGDDGNYIMFARATSGDKKNNRNFSPCSLKSIKPVLLAKARGPKGCFKGNF